jgi:hypothetical protein
MVKPIEAGAPDPSRIHELPLRRARQVRLTGCTARRRRPDFRKASYAYSTSVQTVAHVRAEGFLGGDPRTYAAGNVGREVSFLELIATRSRAA